jgi:hypothetical protein
MNLSMAAIARIETGSLTPALSRGERELRMALGDLPECDPSEPSRLASANTLFDPPKSAAHVLLLPPGEGRDEGRALHSSRHGSWSQHVSSFWKAFLSMNHASVAAGVPPAVEGGVSPPGIPGSWSVSWSVSYTLRSVAVTLTLLVLALKALSATAAESFDLTERKERLPWIWQIPARQPVPTPARTAATTDVDRFLRARLEAAGIQPAPPTDDRTWLRRVHFALIGLPPSPETIHAFLNDSSPAKRERIVDVLLQSPHFGERWARHWMDLVRYAESRGHESDFLIPNAWQYRDYLIRALNDDVPYDRFVAEHLAGDLLPPRLNAATGANESVLGTGWAFLGEEVHSPVDIRQDECERVDNKVDVLSKTFLGLTVACARCHDHKFDAISQRDYYALSGFVLGSSYRQVRFETMEQHARAAQDLEELRTRFRGPIAAELAARLKPGLASLTNALLAAHAALQGGTWQDIVQTHVLPSSTLAAWTNRLQSAATNRSHPLHHVAERLAGKPQPVDPDARDRSPRPRHAPHPRPGHRRLHETRTNPLENRRSRFWPPPARRRRPRARHQHLPTDRPRDDLRRRQPRCVLESTDARTWQ